MFEDFIREHPPENGIKPSKKRVNAERAALRSLIKKEEKTVKIQKRRFRPLIVAAACIAAASVTSVSAAAVGGLIDFKALFGAFYKTANENVANTIMKSADNIVCETTDSDYVINVNGIAGDEMTVMLSAELCRADGTPVKEHFVNPTDEKSLLPLNFREGLSDPEINTGSSICFWVNERGNIDITASVYSPSDPMNGERVIIKGDTLYAAGDEYYEALKADPSDLNAAADAYIALNIGWEISFDYNYSGEAAVTKTLASDEPFTYHLSLTKENPDGGYTQYDVKAEELKVTAGAVKCLIDFEIPPTEKDSSWYSGEAVTAYGANEFILIMSDGSKVAMKTETFSWSSGSDTCHCSFTLHYCDSSSSRMIADIENAAAISINGTVYQLK